MGAIGVPSPASSGRARQTTVTSSRLTSMSVASRRNGGVPESTDPESQLDVHWHATTDDRD